MEIKTKETSGACSVGELRKFLDLHESKWTDEDTLYLGKFENQLILSLPYGRGYSYSKVTEAYGCGGFFVIPTNQNGEEINE